MKRGQLQGTDWESYQLDWKLRSPYAKHRKLNGLEGLITLYEEYRALTDSLFALLGCRKFAVETDVGDWPVYYTEITRALKALDVRV